MYLDKILPFVQKPVIKVIIGLRRSGKSYFIKLLINELLQQNIPQKNILCVPCELFLKNLIPRQKIQL